MAHAIKSLIPLKKKNQNWPQIFIIFTTCISSIAYGATFAWNSPFFSVLISNSSDISAISLEEASYFTVIPPVATILSMPVVVYLLKKFGSKKLIVSISVTLVLSWLFIIFAKDVNLIYISRFFEGIAEGIFFASVPLYVAEISVPKIRGTWGNLPSLACFVGVFIVNVVGNLFDIRTSAYILISVPILHFILSMHLPESPYFLIVEGRIEEARNCLQTLRWKENVEDELQTLINGINRQISETGTWKDLFTISTNIRALLVTILLRIVQMLSGLFAFISNSQYIFEQVGGDISASVSSITFTGFLVTAISIFWMIIDKFGRRPSLLLSSLGCSVATAIEAIYFYFLEKTEWDITRFNWVPLSGMIFFLITCAARLTTLPTLMLGELFSTTVKSKGACINIITYSLGNLIVPKLFLILSSNFRIYSSFSFLSVSTLIGGMFLYLYVPETKGKTLEEIQRVL